MCIILNGIRLFVFCFRPEGGLYYSRCTISFRIVVKVTNIGCKMSYFVHGGHGYTEYVY
jgi:hypothetical protein